MTTCYKLFRVRKDKTLGSLFINRKAVVPAGEWIDAEDHPTRGFAHRPGWHALLKPEAPHLSVKGRRWFKCLASDYEIHERPAAQGGRWLLARKLKVMDEV